MLLIQEHGATLVLSPASTPDLMRLSSKTACCERRMSLHSSHSSGAFCSFSSLPRAPRDPGQAPLALLPPSVLLLQKH